MHGLGRLAVPAADGSACHLFFAERAIHVETFEPRLVFSVTLSGGVLNLVGNDSDNKLLVYKGSSTTTIVEENNVKKTLATCSITNITTDLKGGNDTLDFRRDILGGGDWTIQGNALNNVINASISGAWTLEIYGNNGRDWLTNMSVVSNTPGRVELYGGAGDDSLYGSDNADSFLGGAGRNILYGGSGVADKDSTSNVKDTTSSIEFLL